MQNQKDKPGSCTPKQ
jgi:secondary thiamine-phosphate synthase enzyme